MQVTGFLTYTSVENTNVRHVAQPVNLILAIYPYGKNWCWPHALVWRKLLSVYQVALSVAASCIYQ
ncbi:hypothetical protein DXN05_09735 [Deminuibacter soli]|uniref:Uncharacterized protein n=1 Tax=Deminuibacter soli TaxID=2291815 RepID=A0A3E1NM81_9BACT|nr:hypothetical protein DXN05_09735 [Deminuibacter soli]